MGWGPVPAPPTTLSLYRYPQGDMYVYGVGKSIYAYMGTTKQYVEVAVCNTSLLQTSNEVDCAAPHQKTTDSV